MKGNFLKKILWVKFGWSEYYRGGDVDGNFGWLTDERRKPDGARGHEAFNFAPGPDGTYYCYVPPQSGNSAPSNDDRDGWTVICLAKNPKHTGIHIIGWYEEATLHGEWLERPPGMIAKRGNAQHPAYDWSYCITSKTVYFIPPEHRKMPFSDPAIRIGKYSFLEGPGVTVTDNKRRVLQLLEGRRRALATVAIKNPNDDKLPDPELDSVDPLKRFGTAEHRKKVEVAAENAVIERYKSKGYTCERVSTIPCGHDFVFRKGKAELHIEVKGTAGVFPQFFLTRNEHIKGLKSNTLWRLAMVTSALSEAPIINEYDAAALGRAFDLEPYVFIGTHISRSNGQ